MKKFDLLALVLFLCGIFSQAQTFQNTTASTVVDGVQRAGQCGFGVQPGVEMSNITVSTVGTIIDPSKITINLSIDAGWLGDVVVDLVSPQGEAVTLIRRINAISNTACGDSSNFAAANILSFNSSNTAQIDHSAGTSAYDIPSGNYLPSFGTAKYPIHAPTNLATFFTGRQLNGEWRLVVYDYGVGEPTTLQSWQMIVGTGATLKTSDVAATFGSVISLKQNPVEDFLLIDVNTDFKSLNLEIYDASGKIVKKENVLRGAKDLRIPASELTPGMYLLVPIKDGQKIQPIKFIKK